MRHRNKKHLKLKKRDVGHRNSIYRSLLTGLFQYTSIVTTEKRALAITPDAHRLIDIVNSDTAEHNKIRAVMAELFTKEASVSLMSLAKAYKDRNGGYTRMTAIKYRDGDSAKLVKLELV